MATLILTITGSAFLSLILGVFIDKGFWIGILFLGCISIPFLVYIIVCIEKMRWRGDNG